MCCPCLLLIRDSIGMAVAIHALIVLDQWVCGVIIVCAYLRKAKIKKKSYSFWTPYGTKRIDAST